MRRSLAGLVVSGLLLAGCGSGEKAADGASGGASDEPSASASASPSGTPTPRMGGGSLDYQGYPTVEKLAAAMPVVLLGTVASWEKGPTVVLEDTPDGERVRYAVLVIAVDQVLGDHDGVVSSDEVFVPVRLEDGDVASYEKLAPAGSNVAFLGGEDVGLSTFGGPGEAKVEDADAGSGDGDALLWGGFQGVLLETPSGVVVNADPYSRADVWTEIAALPAEEQFGMLAQRLMALG